jgi:putative tricarboxylic transport membrane protein
VLGEMIENTLKQSLIIFDHNWLRFFERPIVDFFFALAILGLFSPLLFKMFQSRK